MRNLDLKVSVSKDVLRIRLKAALGMNEETDEEEDESISNHDSASFAVSINLQRC